MDRKQILAVALASIMTIGGATAQPLALGSGTTIDTEILSYTTPLQKDALAWVKMKPKKKVEAVMLHNADVLAGKVAPVARTPIPTVIKDVVRKDGITTCTGTTRLGVTDYRLTLHQTADSVYYLLNDGLQFAIPGKAGDTVGVWCFGPRVFPVRPTTDMYLPGHINEMDLLPHDLKLNRKELFRFGKDGYSYSGYVNVRKTVRMQVNNIMMNTPYLVAGTEQIEISGKTYTAYHLINEFWTKLNSNAVVTEDPATYFNDKALSDMVKEHLAERGRGWDTPERKAAILEKMQSATGMTTNAQGYMVSMQENWYVPELGLMIRSRSYDASGALQMESKVTAIR